MNCDALLKGTAECLQKQGELYRQARQADYKASSLRDNASELKDSSKKVAAAQKDYDACLATQPAAPKAPAPKPPPATTTPDSSPPTPVAGTPLGPPPPPNWPPVTPPPAPGSITCNYTDGTPTGRASFTTTDPQFLKDGCPPIIFPNLTLIPPPGGPGVMGPLTPLSPPPLTPVPPSSGGGGGGGGPLPPPTGPSHPSSDWGTAPET